MNLLVRTLHEAFLDRRLGMLLVTALVAAAPWYLSYRLISHDVGWMLASANQLLDGTGRLYQDIFFEVNPPLALFLKLPVVLFARTTGLFEVDVLLTYVFLLSGASIGLIAHQISRLPQIDSLTRRSVVLGVLLSLLLLPGPDFGQREHFLLIFCLPYLVLSALRSAGHCPGGFASLLAGTMAALGFVLKPYFLLLPLLVEIYVLVRTRSLTAIMRPEAVAMVLTGLGYALFVVVATPEYLTDVLPVVLALYDGAFRSPWRSVLVTQETLLIALALIMHLAYRKRQTNPCLGDIFAIAAAAFLCAYIVQMKGWHYHVVPALAAAFCTLCLLVAGILDSAMKSTDRPSQHATASIVAMLCMLVVASVTAKQIYREGGASSFAEALVPIIEQHAPEGMIYGLSTNVSAGFPAVNYGRARWGSRYSTLWMLPGIIRKQADPEALDPAESARVSAFESAFRETVLEDLTKSRPDLIILDDREDKAYFGGLPFDYVGYFSSDPRFRELWAAYDPVDRIGGFLIFKRRQTNSLAGGP